MKIFRIVILLSLIIVNSGFCQNMTKEEFVSQLLGSPIQHGHFTTANDLFSDYTINYDLDFSLKAVQISTIVPPDSTKKGVFKWIAPDHLTIKALLPKFGANDVIIILLSNGDLYNVYWSYDQKIWSHPEKTGTFSGSFEGSEQKLIGDALYIADGSRVFVSRDTAQTWQIDTVGLSGTVYDIDVDTNNYVWAATYYGVFTQHPDSIVWHQNSTFPVTNCKSIFVDKRGWVFVGADNVYKSTDNGASWDNLSGASFAPVRSLSEDDFGNIYAVGSAGGYRSDGGTSAWVNVTDNLAEVAAPSTGSSYIKTSGIVNSISGDTLIYAATAYGLFTSSDQGKTWNYDETEQLPAYRFYGLVRSGMYYLVSTNTGVYRIKDGDTTFTKVLPSTGFRSSISLATDSLGNVYSIVPVDIGSNSTKGDNYKSTDNGATWFRDSTGQGQYSIEFWHMPYFVDNEGVQYVSNNGAMWIKKQNEPWKLDTLGLNILPGEKITDISLNNKKGMLFAVKEVSFYYKYELYYRLLSDLNWKTLDISSFGNALINISSDEEGNIILYSNKGDMGKFDGTTLTSITGPTANSDSLYANHMTVDKKGNIWGSFVSTSDYSFKGIYYSSDKGVTWIYAGLDSTNINFLSTFGDTTFAVTANEGIYFFTFHQSTNIEEYSNNLSSFYKLFQNYPNPFNPTTKIKYSIPSVGKQSVASVKLIIYDILGREVTTLVNKQQLPGNYEVEFNASGLASGIYFYRLKAGDYMETKKMLLLK